MHIVWTSGVILGSLGYAAAPPKDAVESYWKLPVRFEANRGQTDPQVRYFARGLGYAVFLTPTETVLVVPRKGTVRTRLAGSNPAARLEGGAAGESLSHYFIGARPHWRTNVESYSRVELRQAYPGTDVVYYGNQNQLEYDFVLSPGADPRIIRLAFEGITGLTLDEEGGLTVKMERGELRQRKPRAYQVVNGTAREVPSRFVLLGKREAGFQVGDYDRSATLVIDPVLDYSTYLGGSGDDRAYAVAVDSEGCAYLAGETSSLDFPRAQAARPAYSGYSDVFVSKFAATGNALVYSTYLGGRGRDSGRAIAVDSAGNAYVTGFTYAADFPTTANALQTALGGSSSAFVAKLSASGSTLVYSTYLGGSGVTYGSGIDVDSTGSAYVTGYTSSLNFPVSVGAFRTSYAGGSYDAFVTKLNPAGSGLSYSTYLGGAGTEVGRGIAVDAEGCAYAAGQTDSSDFPVRNPVQQCRRNGDAFVTKLNPGGNALAYSTCLGGNGVDTAAGVAVDASGAAYVAGSTFSADFPVTAGAYQGARRGSYDFFVSKLSATGSYLAYSTYLGGSGSEDAAGVAIDAAGNAIVAGSTDAGDFPVKNAVQTYAGGRDVVIAALDASGGALRYSTYLGGSADDYAGGAAVSGPGDAYVAGFTYSSDFPSAGAAYQRTPKRSSEAFAGRLRANSPPEPVSVAPSAGSGISQVFSFLYSDADGAADLVFTYVAIGTGLSAYRTCVFQYYRPQHNLWLINDEATGWLGPVAVGSSADLENSQCRLSGAGTVVSVSGDEIRIDVPITLKSAMGGVRNIYLDATDASGATHGWQQKGSWTVPPTGAMSFSVTPSSGVGPRQTFTFTYSNSSADLPFAYMTIGANPTGFGNCAFQYYRPTNTLWLVNDELTGWIGPILAGSDASIENSLCQINGAGASAYVTGDQLTVTAPVAFKAAFDGPRNVYMNACDAQGVYAGYQQKGTWVVARTGAVSVAPTAGTGSTQIFSFTYFDSHGASALAFAYALIGENSNSGAGVCAFQYYRLHHNLWLVNDGGSGWLGPIAIGVPGTLENSQCRLEGAGASVTTAGDQLRMDLPITFKPSFAGTKQIYLNTLDESGIMSGWALKGSWTPY